MAFIDTRKLLEREPKPGWHGRFFNSERMSFAYYGLEAGASLPEHSHPNEEVWNVVGGEVEITIGGDRHRAGPGCAAVVPPNTAHSVRAIAASTVIVVDAPLRGDVGGGERAALAIQFTELLDPSRAPSGAPIPIAISFEIQNHGRSDGIVKRIEIDSAVAASLPPPTRTLIPTGELSLRIAIAGGGSHSATHPHPPLTAAQREQLRGGKAVFYVRGVVLYEDADGERHHTTFCRILDAAHGLIPPESPGYNYGD